MTLVKDKDLDGLMTPRFAHVIFNTREDAMKALNRGAFDLTADKMQKWFEEGEIANRLSRDSGFKPQLNVDLARRPRRDGHKPIKVKDETKYTLKFT